MRAGSRHSCNLAGQMLQRKVFAPDRILGQAADRAEELARPHAFGIEGIGLALGGWRSGLDPVVVEDIDQPGERRLSLARAAFIFGMPEMRTV